MNFFNRVTYVDRAQAIQETTDSIRNYKVTVLQSVDQAIDLRAFYSELADTVGPAAPTDEDLRTGEMTGSRWIEISYDPAMPDRYRTAKVHQPLHTDASYLDHKESVTYFFCESQAPLGGATTFLDTDTLFKAMELDNEAGLQERLQTIEVRFTKGGSSVKRPILIEDSKGVSLNFNYYCLDSDNTEEAKKLVEDFHRFLETRVRPAGLDMPVCLQPRDAVFFHDYRLLHGRNAYFANAKGQRCLVKGVILLGRRNG